MVTARQARSSPALFWRCWRCSVCSRCAAKSARPALNEARPGFPEPPRGCSLTKMLRTKSYQPGNILMRAFFLLAACLIGLASPTGAADDGATAQRIILSPAEAFSHHDAAAHYSYTAPS